MVQKSRRVWLIILLLLMVWVGGMAVDYWQVFHRFQKPWIAQAYHTADDGGSGVYQGIAYSFDLKGNFMPEDEFPGVTQAQFHLLGKMISSTVRD